jgi:hypothetical protein
MLTSGTRLPTRPPPGPPHLQQHRLQRAVDAPQAPQLRDRPRAVGGEPARGGLLQQRPLALGHVQHLGKARRLVLGGGWPRQQQVKRRAIASSGRQALTLLARLEALWERGGGIRRQPFRQARACAPRAHLAAALGGAEHEHRVAVAHRLLAQPRADRGLGGVLAAPAVDARPVGGHLQRARHGAVHAHEARAHLHAGVGGSLGFRAKGGVPAGTSKATAQAPAQAAAPKTLRANPSAPQPRPPPLTAT